MLKKAYADTASGQMHYYHGGPRDQAPILFLHQNVSSAKAFLPTLQKLVDRHHCIALDLPGFGGSFDPPAFDSISVLTGYTLEFLDALGFETFHLCGSHTGAGISAEIASLHPTRALSCMMIGALLFTEEQRAHFRSEFSGSAAPGFDAAYLKETWDFVYDIGGKVELDNMHEEFVGALRNWRVRDMIFRCVWDYPFGQFLPKIQCPTLLMCAPDDVLYPGHLNTAAAMPQAKAIDVQGMDMEPNLDPDGVSRGIIDFLAENRLS